MVEIRVEDSLAVRKKRWAEMQDYQRDYVREVVRARAADWRRRNKNLIKGALVERLGGGCRECGFDKLPALHFHHTGNHKKESEVSKLINSMDVRAILREVDKCIVLCANCHAMHHAGKWDKEIAKLEDEKTWKQMRVRRRNSNIKRLLDNPHISLREIAAKPEY